MSPNPPTRRSFLRSRGGRIAILALAILAAYAGTWNAPFVYDDILAIPENPTIRRLWPLTDVLLPQAQGGLTVSGRPVLNLSFALNHAISGTSPWSYHLFNVLVHLGSALLLTGIVRRTLERRNPPALLRRAAAAPALALAIAALWGLHPLLTQAVTYTVQRAESLMAFFYLFTLYGFVRATEPASSPEDRRRWQVTSVVACIAGMATKEVMATAPLLVFLFDRTFVAGTCGEAWRRRRGYHLALAATWVVLGALVLSTGGNRGGTVGLGVGVPLWAYPLTQFQAVARYLLLAGWPHPLVFEYGTFWVQRATDIAPFALLTVPLLGATLVALRRAPALGFCGAWFFLILAPTSLAPGTIQMIVEHRAYLPLTAVIAAAVCALHALCARRTWWVVATIAVSFGLLTAARNRTYATHVGLWSDTVAKRPLNPRAHDGLAEAYEEQGRNADALPHRREAIRLLPDEAHYHYNLALNLADTGQLDDAERHYRLALRLVPQEARTHNNLGTVLARRGDDAGALVEYAEAVRLDPTVALFHYNHGVALLRAHRFAEAVRSYEAALALHPDYADAHFNLATAWVKMNRLDPALVHYTAALRLKPTDAGYRTTFAGALLLAGKPAEALAEFQRVLADHPDAIDARLGAGGALAALRRFDEAIPHFEAVLRASPQHANAHFKLGNALLDVDRVEAAVGHLQEAVRLAPNDAEAHQNLGVGYARLERWTEARREFETALQLKPDYPDARRNLEQLRSLLGR